MKHLLSAEYRENHVTRSTDIYHAEHPGYAVEITSKQGEGGGEIDSVTNRNT